jgi:membrane protein
MDLKAIFNLFRDTFKDWSEDKAARLGAALAYYTIFSVGPLLLIAIAIAGLVFGQQRAQDQIVGTIRTMVGGHGAEVIIQAIQNASKPGASIVASAIGIVTLLFGASGVFGQLKDALNTIWEVKPKPGQGILAMARDRFLSFTMVLGTGFLLLVSLVISAALTALGSLLSKNLPGGDLLWQIVNYVLAILVIALVFAMLFKFLPDVQIAWRDVAVGALITSLLFNLGQIALGLYLGSGSVGSAYGAAGSLVIVLVWIYYSAQILFFGAEFTQVYARTYGTQVKPAPDAEFITEEGRAQQGITRDEGGKHARARQRRREQGAGAGRLASPWFK